MRDARHAQPSLVESPCAARDREQRDRAVVDRDPHAERLGDAVGGDVVMRRADAAGGEEIGVARAHRVQRRDDLRLDVGNDAHLAQVDADAGQVLGDEADVLVLGPPRQDLIADDKQRGGDDFGAGTGSSTSPAFGHNW